MNVTNTASSLSIAARQNESRVQLDAAANNTTARLSQAQTSSGNANTGAISTTDSVSLSSSASAISTNISVNRVLSDILGPQGGSGNSASSALVANFSSNALEDPAAKYRSTEKVALEGYDQSKLDNPEHRTPKYIFGRVAQGFKLDSVTGKPGAEELLKAMVPDLKKAGLEIVSVERDRIQVKTELGYEWVDVIRGAESGNPGWWWGSEGKGTPQPTSSAKEWAALTGQSAAATMAVPSMAGGAAAPSGPKFTPLGNQIDQSKVLPVLQKYSVLDIEKAVADPEIQKAYPGAKVIPHPQRLDKIQFPNGAVVDCVVAAGDPSAKWGWMPEN